MATYSIEIFSERPDSRFWPIPGVYAAKTALQHFSVDAAIHDTFIQIPDSILVEYLVRKYRGRTVWAGIYLAGAWRDIPDGIPLPWARIINDKMTSLRQGYPNIKYCIMGLLPDELFIDDAFNQASAIFRRGYDSLLEMATVFNISSPKFDYGGRKSVKYVPANGYLWRSANMMIDMPECHGHCINCSREPTTCLPYKRIKATNLASNIKELERELNLKPQPFNLTLTSDSLKISETKFHLLSNMMHRVAPNGEIELHLNSDFLRLAHLKEFWAFIKEHRIGSLNVCLYGATPKGRAVLGYTQFDIQALVARLRESMGPVAYLMVTIHIGLPGDSIASIERLLDSLRMFSDQISVEPYYVVASSPLAQHEDYSIIAGRNIDIWNSCEWILPSLSLKEAIAWCRGYHDSSLVNAAYRNYRRQDDVLYANNNGFSSKFVRDDLDKAKDQGEGANWLAKVAIERHLQLSAQYQHCYETSR